MKRYQKINRLKREIEKAQETIEKNTMEITYLESLPSIRENVKFKDMTMAEQALLYTSGQSVYNFFRENPEMTIEAYEHLLSPFGDIDN